VRRVSGHVVQCHRLRGLHLSHHPEGLVNLLLPELRGVGFHDDSGVAGSSRCSARLLLPLWLSLLLLLLPLLVLARGSRWPPLPVLHPALIAPVRGQGTVAAPAVTAVAAKVSIWFQNHYLLFTE
jgi:hypothetical protein